MIDQLSRVLGENAQQLWHYVQLLNPSNVTDVALNDGLNVVPDASSSAAVQHGSELRDIRLREQLRQDHRQ